MTDWMKRANHEISKMRTLSTAITAERNIENPKVKNHSTANTAVRFLSSAMAVPELVKSEVLSLSNDSNGSTFSGQIQDLIVSDKEEKLIGIQADYPVHFMNSPEQKKEQQNKERKHIVWKADEESLIQWFLSANDLPTSSFQLKQAVHVSDPQKFYDSLRANINEGPKTARALFGALQDDLRCLKKIVEVGIWK